MNASLDTVSWFTVSPMIHSFAFRRKFSMSLRPRDVNETGTFETETETETKILETGLETETTMIVKLLRDRDIHVHTGCS